jgi:hypothetical protein
MNLQTTQFLTSAERKDLRLWSEYRAYAKKWNVHPLEYLKLMKGKVFREDLLAITGIDDMVDDAARMRKEIRGQKQEMERKVDQGKAGYAFDRI